jgi:nucleotide-binding universal stress UspA family protein
MFKKVLVPLDRSPLAEEAVGQAAAIARRSNAAIDFVMVHTSLPYDGLTDATMYDEMWKDDLKYVESIAREVEAGGGLTATFAVPKGDVIDGICARAIEVDADLIVMTSHGRTGLSRAWLGSVADGVMRHGKSPVLMLRPVESKSDRFAARKPFTHMMVTLDGSTLSEEILSPALALARCEDLKLSLVRVVQPVPMPVVDITLSVGYAAQTPDPQITKQLVDDARLQMAGMAKRLKAQGFKVDTEVVVNPFVAQAILDFADDHAVDVIAVSSHGRGASRLVFGSVADKLVRASGCAVLVQRPVGLRNVERLASDSDSIASSPAFAHV